MTRQLNEAKQASEQQQREVEGARGYLESVLTHLSSGVLALDREFNLRSTNTIAAQILGAPLQEMQRLSLAQIAEKHGRRVIEDCAQSPGASIGGKKVGTFGDFGCYSFHGAKNMTPLGEGGMLAVRSDADALLASGLRHNGVRA